MKEKRYIYKNIYKRITTIYLTAVNLPSLFLSICVCTHLLALEGGTRFTFPAIFWDNTPYIG